MEKEDIIEEVFDSPDWPDMEKELLEYYKEQCEGYKTFLTFLIDECVYSKDRIIEAVNDSEWFKVFGKVKGEWVTEKNELYVVAEVPDSYGYNGNEKVKIKAKWQHSDNYAVWQRCEFEDSYRGYLLIPAYNMKDFLCVYYNC